MSDPSLNPSQQVERIREILVGRQMHQVEDRLRQLESTIKSQGRQMDDEVIQRVQNAQATVLQETHNLRVQLQNETQLRSEQISKLTDHLNAATRRLQDASSELHREGHHVEEHLAKHLENISSAMASRIDARVREILQHLQAEIVQWKNQTDRDIMAVREAKADRHELRSKFARLAAAAMEDDPPPGPEDGEQGFLL